MNDELRVAAGTLLAAWPDLEDPNFAHSVVVVCQHSDEGAYGLVTNRRTQFTVAELLPDHPVLGKSSFPVHLGGPVDHSTLQFLHRVPDRIPGGLCLDGELWFGGDFDAMARYASGADPKVRSRLRLFVGYSGWGAGQLEGELQANSWLPAPSSIETVFRGEGEDAWRRVVTSVGTEGFEDLPGDTSMN